jgi:hypothetical protein
MAKDRCKHSGCRCTPNDTRVDGFCSDACKEHRENAGKCQCGHGDCK